MNSYIVSLCAILILYIFFIPIFGTDEDFRHTHTCDFNTGQHSLSFTEENKKEKTSFTVLCSIKPDALDEVNIKCGDEQLNYTLHPPNCVHNFYDSIELKNEEALNKHKATAVYLVEDTKQVTVTKTEENDNVHSEETYTQIYESSFIITPSRFPNENIFCACVNEETIDGSKVTATGIIQISVPYLETGIQGCDFSFSEGTANYNFSKYFNESTTAAVDDEGKTDSAGNKEINCIIEAQEGSVIGFKCPADAKIEPSGCFLEAFNSENELEDIHNTIGLTNVIIDHYEKMVLAKVPMHIDSDTHFSCYCVKKDGQKYSATFNIYATKTIVTVGTIQHTHDIANSGNEGLLHDDSHRSGNGDKEDRDADGQTAKNYSFLPNTFLIVIITLLFIIAVVLFLFYYNKSEFPFRTANSNS